jgi:hypothetical protein
MRELTTRADRTADAPARENRAYHLDFFHVPAYDTGLGDLRRTEGGGAHAPAQTAGALDRTPQVVESDAARPMGGGGRDHG